MSFSISDLGGNPAPQNTPAPASSTTPPAIAPSNPGSFSMSDLGSAPPPTVATANPPTPQKSAWQHFKDSALETVGSMVPQAAIPFMAADKKYIADAADQSEAYLAKKGGQAGLLPAEFLSSIRPENDHSVEHPENLSSYEELAKKEHPYLAGTGESIGELAGSFLGPKNIAIAALLPENVAGKVLSRVASSAFAAQMGSGVVDAVKDLAVHWDSMSTYEKAKALSSSAIQTVLAGLAADHATTREPGVPTSASNPAATPAPTPLDERTVIRPTTKTVDGVKIPIPAIAQDSPGAVTRVASAIADKAKAKEFQNTQTKPAAHQAVLSTVGHVAEDKIAAHNALVDGTDRPEPITGTNTPSKFQDFDDIHTATQNAAQRTYAKADDVSAKDIADWQEKVKEALAAAKQTVDQHNANVDEFNANRNTADEEPQERIQFDPSKVNLPEKPQTYNELKSALDTAKRNARSPDAVVSGEAIDNGIPKAQKAVDNWFRQHSDQISLEEYQSAKSLYSDSQRFGDIAQALRQPLKDGTITGNKLRQIENLMNQEAFDNGGPPDRFQRLLGPDGYQNWRDTTKLFDPVKGLPGGSWGSIAAGFLAERVFGPLGAFGVGAAKAGQWVLNRALFDPEFGSFLKDTANYLKNSHQAAIASPLFQLPKDLYARAQAFVEKAKPVVKALGKNDRGEMAGEVGARVPLTPEDEEQTPSSGTEAAFEKAPVEPTDQTTQTYSSPSEGVHQVLTEGPNGTNRGYLFAKDVDGNPYAVRIASHGVEEASRGQGIGPSQIENLAWNLNGAGKTTLLSDLQMTDAAKRAWDKVQAKFPNAVTKTPSGYIFDLEKLTPGASDIVGTAAGAKNDTDLFQQAKAELGDGAPISQVAQRAQELKTQTPAPDLASKEIPTQRPTSVKSDVSNVPNAPTFYSKAAKVAADKIGGSGSGDQILATLRNNGVKDSEMQWMGLDDFLKGKPKVSKADLQQFINENQIRLDEKTLGGDDQSELENLRAQRSEAYAENDRLWHGYMRYTPGTSAMMDAMREGRDVEPIISKMPANAQKPARRFVETDQQIRDLDEKMDEVKTRVKPAKYADYTLPGYKSDYTEKLLTLPDKRGPGLTPAEQKELAALQEKVNKDKISATDPRFRELWTRSQERPSNIDERQGHFMSSHFDEPNILAHVRYDTRKAADGAKTLMLEEVQSDWHQKGKQAGYVAPSKYSELPEGYKVVENKDIDGYPMFTVIGPNGTRVNSYSRQDAINHVVNGLTTQSPVPDAPFKSDWHELVMKRMLRHAAENGYDRLAWTTGDQQAERYNLSKQVDKISYDPETKTLNAYKDGDTVLNEHGVEPQEVQNYVGKDPAKKILSSEPDEMGFHTATGDDLKVGGDWAKNLYDKAIPNFLNKYAKKWGAKVGTTSIPTAVGPLERDYAGPNLSLDEMRQIEKTVGSVYLGQVRSVISDMERGVPFRDAMNGSASVGLAEHLGGKIISDRPVQHETVHSIDITPAMRQSVLKEGQPIAKNEPKSWASGILESAAV